MPRDARGRSLRAGDLVLVPFRVTAVDGDTCLMENISIDTSAVLRANPGDEIDYQVIMAIGIPPESR